MNCMIEPREPCLLNDRKIHVLWSRDSNFDSRPGVRYHPNHFVPLFVVSGEAVRSEKLDPQTESRGQLKITSLLKNKNISTTLDRKPASTTWCIPANNSVSKPASKSSSVKRKAVFDDSAQSKKRKTHARGPVCNQDDVDNYDIGLFCESSDQLTEDQLYDFIKKLWKPGKTFQYLVTIESGKNRKFNLNWFDLYAWLAYSKYLDGIFCIPRDFVLKEVRSRG